jgi:hypothetical protein
MWIYLFYVAVVIVYLVYKFNSDGRFSGKVADIVMVAIVLPLAGILLQTILNPIINSEKLQNDQNFQNQVLELMGERRKEKEALKQRITTMYQDIYNSTAKEADKWAAQFFTSLNVRLDLKKQEKKDEEQRYTLEREKLPVLFKFIIDVFDSYVAEFLKKSSEIKAKRKDVDDIINNFLILDSGTSKPLQGYIRRITFENGHSLTLNLSQGKLKNGRIWEYPSIRCREDPLNFDEPKRVSFSIHKPMSGYIKGGRSDTYLVSDIWYNLDMVNLEGNGNVISEDFKNKIHSSFQSAFSAVFLRQKKINTEE